MHYLGISILALTLLFFAQWTITKTKKAASTPTQATLVNAPQPEPTYPLIPPCIEMPELPSGKRGHFCAPLKGGMPTKIIKPPMGTFTKIILDAPGGEIEYFDYASKSLGVKITDGPLINNCAPHGSYAFRVTLKEEGTATMRVTDRPLVIPNMPKCS